MAARITNALELHKKSKHVKGENMSDDWFLVGALANRRDSAGAPAATGKCLIKS